MSAIHPEWCWNITSGWWWHQEVAKLPQISTVHCCLILGVLPLSDYVYIARASPSLNFSLCTLRFYFQQVMSPVQRLTSYRVFWLPRQGGPAGQSSCQRNFEGFELPTVT